MTRLIHLLPNPARRLAELAMVRNDLLPGGF